MDPDVARTPDVMAKATELEELKAKAKGGPGSLTDDERRRMMSLMDEELEELMKGAEKRSERQLDHWTEDNWEEEMMKHPFFVNQEAVDKGEMSPVIQVC